MIILSEDSSCDIGGKIERGWIEREEKKKQKMHPDSGSILSLRGWGCWWWWEGETCERMGLFHGFSQMPSEAQPESGVGSLSFLTLHTPQTILPTQPQAGNRKVSVSNTDGILAFRSIPSFLYSRSLLGLFWKWLTMYPNSNLSFLALLGPIQ